MAAGWILEMTGQAPEGERWVRRYIAAVETEQEARAAVEIFMAKAALEKMAYSAKAYSGAETTHSAKAKPDIIPPDTQMVAKPASEAVIAFVALTPGRVMRWN